MMRMEQIIYAYYKDNHLVAQGMDAVELKQTAIKLSERLAKPENELEPTLEGLTLLFDELRNYYQRLNSSHHQLSDIDNIQIVREIAAYFGYLVLHNKGGEWDNPGGLLNVAVRFKGNFVGQKGNRVTKASTRVENIGYLAAGIWDGILLNIDIDVMKYYKVMAQKRIKEVL